MQAYTDGRRMRDQIFYPGVTDPAAAQRLTLQAGDERGGTRHDGSCRSSISVEPAEPARSWTRRTPGSNATAIVKGRVTRPDGSPRSRRASERARSSGARPTTATGPAIQTATSKSFWASLRRRAGPDSPVFRVTAFKAGYQGSDFGQREPDDEGRSRFRSSPGRFASTSTSPSSHSRF